MSFQPFQDTCNLTPKTASIWHNNGNNNNLKGPETPVIAQQL
jgi:hypothetical protein